MVTQISSSVGSWESGAKNNAADVRNVQQLLTAAVKRYFNRSYDPKGIDGKIARIAGRSGTVAAIINFQRTEVRMARPDARIDVNGGTWKKLVAVGGGAPAAAPGLITLTFAHGGKIPTKTSYKSKTASTYSGMYESTVTLSGGKTGAFSGSIFPDDMWTKGHLKDGSYPLHIGFHKGGGTAKQKAKDLIVKTQGIRAGLLVNARNGVSVESENPRKTTSYGVNIHNGFNSKRYSDGCPTIKPSDWSRFVQIFLDAYPDISDWHTIGNNTGKKIGTLVVKS